METAITKVADGRASAEFSGTLAQGRVVAEADQQRRRRPRIIDADWLVMRGLSRLVDCYAARLAKTSRSAIDLGCGNQPYRPYFENRGVAYLGADFDGSADILITPDGRIDAAHSSVDLVLSFQVLEHVRRWAVNCWKAICGPLAWGTIVRLTGCCCAERRIALIRGVLDGPLSPVKNLRAACDDAVASRGISDRNACVYLVQALVQGA